MAGKLLGDLHAKVQTLHATERSQHIPTPVMTPLEIIEFKLCPVEAQSGRNYARSRLPVCRASGLHQKSCAAH